MFQDRNRQPGPGFGPPRGRRMQQPPTPYRQQMQMPQAFQPMRQPIGPNGPQAQPGPNGFRAPFGQQQRQDMPQAKKEGLLSKILGKSKQKAAPPNLFAPAASSNQSSSRSSGGGILETLKNPDSLNNMLANTQKVLQAAEQFTPMVQQYGPVIKNLPSMWKVFRSISSAGVTENGETSGVGETESVTQTNVAETPKPNQKETPPEATPTSRIRPAGKRERSSGPKLYI
ncbi:hypothetical protein GW626_14395 [Peribacillus muralis]|uniref:YqfQ family protein n=1 Tax=Peribacillus muralis TaxID=264697 RepID=UPI001F4DABEA|nr:YqfQ family protein [Peribacillus muralis]MCK1991532.1 YqfQ family protein [Peribacillus muralis]MCK2012091.1 YqfQ family protein [Peribacillus muralis]